MHAWLDLMALVATDPRRRWRSVAVGRPGSAGGDADMFDIGIAGRRPAGRGVANGHSRWRWTAIAAASGNRSLFPGFSYAVHTDRATGRHWSNGHSFPTATIPPWCWPSGNRVRRGSGPAGHDLATRATGSAHGAAGFWKTRNG